MPCRSDYMNDGGAAEIAVANEKTRKVKAELDRITRLLCYACKKLGNNSGGLPRAEDLAIHQELYKWWTEHQIADAKREAEEKRRKDKEEATRKEKKRLEGIRREALSKLTSEQRKVLGV